MRLRAPGVAVRMATADFDLPAGNGRPVHVAQVSLANLARLPLVTLKVQLTLIDCPLCACILCTTGLLGLMSSKAATVPCVK